MFLRFCKACPILEYRQPTSPDCPRLIREHLVAYSHRIYATLINMEYRSICQRSIRKQARPKSQSNTHRAISALSAREMPLYQYSIDKGWHYAILFLSCTIIVSSIFGPLHILLLSFVRLFSSFAYVTE